MNYIIKRLLKLKYLKAQFVLLVDTFISVAATFLAFAFFITIFRNIDLHPKETLYITVLTSLIVTPTLSLIMGLHREVIRHFSLSNVFKIILTQTIKAAVVIVVLYISTPYTHEHLNILLYAGVFDMLLSAFVMIGIRSTMFVAYYYLINWVKSEVKNVFIYSTRGSNPTLVAQINNDTNSKYRIRGFLTTVAEKAGTRISGEQVYYVNQPEKELAEVFERKRIKCIIFTSPRHFDMERTGLVEFAIHHKIQLLMMGSIENVDDPSKPQTHAIKPIQIIDLLNRQEIKIDIEKISNEMSNKVVMVTGAAGSIGSEIANQVASFNPSKLILFDVSETPIHNLQLQLTAKYPELELVFILGDVRSRSRVETIIKRYKPSVIFHAAAYKHVPMVEANPCEGVMTNIWGSVNVATQASLNNVEKFIMISTDKAVNPTNVMGATKRIAEMCVQSMNGQTNTEFITTRFGNVLGSNGSVIPLFRKQIEEGGPVTVTHPDIIRYFMTIPEACRLVLQAATMGHGGEILVFDMGEQVRIADLARKMIQLSGFEPDVDIKIVYTGLRPGEKLYEELLTSHEDTKATNHHKIRIAQSKSVNYDNLKEQIRDLISQAHSGDIDQTVKTMKAIAPEFKSRNSRFELFD